MAGQVVAIDASVEPPEMLVAPQRACADCRACFWRAASVVRIPSDSRSAFAPGDRVQLMLPATAALVGAVCLYGAPLAALVGGALLGSLLVPAGDIGAILGACAGLGLAGAALVHARRWLERRIREGLIIAAAS